jgi:O-antigen/teichoic acid export membrane protein
LFGAIIYNTALNIDSFTIGSKLGLSVLGVYTLAKYISSVISVPQRSVASIAVPYVAQAFKDKRFDEVRRIYMRSAINLLIIALFVFLNVWINLDDAYQVFHLDKSFEAGKYVILILGIACYWIWVQVLMDICYMFLRYGASNFFNASLLWRFLFQPIISWLIDLVL